MAYRDLDPEDAQRELAQNVALRILDVRTHPEHQSHRLPGALLVPLQELHLRVAELDPGVPWLVHCEHGVRSLHACEFLAQQGFRNLTNLRGGLAHWIGKGLPFER
jgi:rhodanese-related sulfurtransferase